MKKNVAALLVLVAISVFFIAFAPAAHAGTIFVGKADLWDGVEDGLLMGSPVFANDHLVVTLNEEGGRYVIQNHWVGAQNSGLNMRYTFESTDGINWELTKAQGTVRYDGQPPAVHFWLVK